MEIEYRMDCWAFFGTVDWDKDRVYEYIASVKRIFALFGTKENRFGFAETPYGTIKGAHMGSPKNVGKKVEAIYSLGAQLKSLEFFTLPKDYNFQYSDYEIFISRNKDFMVIGYDAELFDKVPMELILDEMKSQMVPVWGEHFQITKGNQPLVYCMDRFDQNPAGENLIQDVYVEKRQPIHIIEQFRV